MGAGILHAQLSKAFIQPRSPVSWEVGKKWAVDGGIGSSVRQQPCAVLVGCLLSYLLDALWHQLAPIYAFDRGKAGHGPRVRARHTATLSRVAITQE